MTDTVPLWEAGMRLADRVTEASANSHAGSWLVAKLTDGGGPATLFASRADAVKYHDQHACYVLIPPDGMGLKEAMTFLRFHRGLWDAGLTTASPDHVPLLPHSQAEVAPTLRGLRGGPA